MERWYPEATRWHGPDWKIRGGTHTSLRDKNSVSGIVNHSAVGYHAGLHSVLWDSKRAAAWHFSVLYDGTVEQHYALDEVLYHAGSKFAHNHLIGIEHEGGHTPRDEPLRPEQLEASIALCRWIAEQGGFALERGDGQTLYAHQEVSIVWTDCPSDRIPWDEYLEDEEMGQAYHFVQRGETMSAIAAQHRIPLFTLRNMNAQIEDENLIEVHQPLRLRNDQPMPPLIPIVKPRDDDNRERVLERLGEVVVAVERVKEVV